MQLASNITIVTMVITNIEAGRSKWYELRAIWTGTTKSWSRGTKRIPMAASLYLFAASGVFMVRQSWKIQVSIMM
jgi:hypothetical protein